MARTAGTQAPAPGAGALTRGALQASVARAGGLGSATWRAIGTSAQLLVTDPSALAVGRVEVERILAEVDLAASRFRPDSELTRLNTRADGAWQPISPLLVRLLRVALDAAAWTDGLVDLTVGGALVDLGYDRTFRSLDPDAPHFVVRPQPAPGWQQVDLDDEGARVRIPTGVLVDLGATAKGLASDLAAEAAASAVGGPVLVNLGGDLRAVGAPSGGWSVLVTDSSDPDAVDSTGEAADQNQTVALDDGGLATSSTTARRWQRGGSAVHHLIDPRSGLPTAGPWRTVTVAASTCVLANTASTAAVILGDQAPGWLAARGFIARLVAGDGVVATVLDWPDPAVRPANSEDPS